MCEDGFFCFNSRDSGMQSIEIKNIDIFRYKTFIYSMAGASESVVRIGHPVRHAIYGINRCARRS